MTTNAKQRCAEQDVQVVDTCTPTSLVPLYTALAASLT